MGTSILEMDIEESETTPGCFCGLWRRLRRCFKKMARKRRSSPGAARIRVPVVDEESPALAQDDHADEAEDLHTPGGGEEGTADVLCGGEDDGTADVPADLHDGNEVDCSQSSKVHPQETDTYEAIIEECGSTEASRKEKRIPSSQCDNNEVHKSFHEQAERYDAGSPYVMKKGYETTFVFLDGSEPSVRNRSKPSPKKKSERIKSASYEDFETFCAMQEEETEFGKGTYVRGNYVPSTQEFLGLLQSGGPVTWGGISGTRRKKKNRKSSPPVDGKNEEGKTSGHGQRYMILLAVFVVLLPLCLFLALPMYFTSTHDSHMQKYIRAQREGRWADVPLEYRDEVITKSGKKYSKHLLKPDDHRWALDVTYAERKHRTCEDKSEEKSPLRPKRATEKTTPQRENQAGIDVFQKIYDVVQFVAATTARGFSLTINSTMETAARIRHGSGVVIGASCGGVTRFMIGGYSAGSQVFKFVIKGVKAYWRRGYNAERKIIKLMVWGTKMFFRCACNGMIKTLVLLI